VLCEVCGKESLMLKCVKIEGSELNACPECARFGVEKSPRPKMTTAPVHVSDALEKRERRAQQKDVFSETAEELVPDFAQRIRKARERQGWSPEDLGKKLNEKKSVVLKLETGQMKPDDQLVKKLERLLGIKLKDTPTAMSTPRTVQQRGLTLGDFVRYEKVAKKK
jgi:putative transcription factor